MGVAAALGIDAGLQRGRRRGQDDRRVLDAPAHHRHVAGVIGDAVLLLVGGLVLLIDDDQAEIAIGQEQRRARAGHHRRLACGDRRLQPLAPARRSRPNATAPAARRSGPRTGR